MEILHATVADAEDVLALQRLAYVSEAEIYNDFRIPPLTQTLGELRDDFRRQIFLKVTLDRKIVGSVRAFAQNDTVFVGRLIVHPQYQDQGIGTAMLKEIETQFGAAMRYELFTGHKSEKNIRLHQKVGCRIFKSHKVNNDLTMVYMEKGPRPTFVT